MRKKGILIIIISILLIIYLGVSDRLASTAMGEDIMQLKVGKTVKKDFESTKTDIYSMQPQETGLLTLTVKGYIQDAINVSIYPMGDSDAVLSEYNISYDAAKDCSYKQFKFYVGSVRIYYINISHPIDTYEGSYEINTKLTRIDTCDSVKVNDSQSSAISMSQNNIYRGIVTFDEEVDYCSIKVTAGKHLKFKISTGEEDEVLVTVLDSAGKPLSDFMISRTSPYTYDKKVTPGTYFIAIDKRSIANMEGIQYEIITGDYKRITSISIPSGKKLYVKDTYTIKPVLNPKDANEKYTYYSNNSKVASVTSSGKVTALKSGTAVITVTSVNGKVKSNDLKITVEVAVSKVTLNKTSATIYVGDSLTLKATVSPNDATNKKVTWKSSNPKVAAVSSSGKVTAKGKGKCTITAYAGGKKATAAIEVKPRSTPTVTPTPNVTVTPTPQVTPIPIEDIIPEKSSYSISVGESVTIKVEIVPGNATDKTLIWKSDDPSVASVSNGKVKGLKHGTAVITIMTKDSKVVKRCTIEVN